MKVYLLTLNLMTQLLFPPISNVPCAIFRGNWYICEKTYMKIYVYLYIYSIFFIFYLKGSIQLYTYCSILLLPLHMF